MLLAVDVGNTQTAIGLFTGPQLTGHWRMATDQQTTADEVHLTLHGLLELAGYRNEQISGMALSSVVPPLTDIWEEVSARICGTAPVLASVATAPWVSLSYDNPEEIGADRIADTVAALDTYGAPVVVVDLGTATNIEVIDREGSFVGGIIAPGLVTSTNALFAAAARIPRFDIVEPRSVLGKTTRDAVRSGLLYGEVDRIDGLVHRIWDELGYRTRVIGTGGLVSTIADLSTTIETADPNLTLRGLRIIYERNQG